MLADVAFKGPAVSVQKCPLSCGHGHSDILLINSCMIYLLSTCLWEHEFVSFSQR